VEVVNQAAALRSDKTLVLGDIVNAAADRYVMFQAEGSELLITVGSFYSSQGRQTSFPDHNSSLIQRLLSEVPRLTTLEVCQMRPRQA
jgi:hypothetical protein